MRPFFSSGGSIDHFLSSLEKPLFSAENKPFRANIWRSGLGWPAPCLVSSTSDAFRMIKQGAVKIEGERVEDRALEVAAGTCHVYQVGRRKFARVSVT